MTKKFISLLLALTMIIPMLSVNVFADNNKNVIEFSINSGNYTQGYQYKLSSDNTNLSIRAYDNNKNGTLIKIDDGIVTVKKDGKNSNDLIWAKGTDGNSIDIISAKNGEYTISFTGCSNTFTLTVNKEVVKTESYISASDINLDYDNEKHSFGATLSPTDGRSLSYEVTFGDDVITLTDTDMFIAKKAGEATVKISVSTTDTAKATETNIKVTINKINSTISAGNIEIPFDTNEHIINATVTPERELTYTLKDGEDVITLTDNRFTAKKAGTATVTIHASATDTAKATDTDLTITIKKLNSTISASDIEFDYDTETHYINATLSPTDTRTLTYTVTSGSDVINLNGNTFTALKAGMAKVLISATDSDTAESVSKKITITINPKAVVVSGITAENKVYDGNNTATLSFTNVKFDGETIEDLGVTATGIFENSDAGTNKKVSINGLALTGTNAGKYKLSESGNQTETNATITKKAVVVSGITAENKIYDGNNTATLSFTNVKFNNNETINGLSVTATGTFEDKNAGENKTVTIADIKLTGTDAKNHELAGTENQTETNATIAPMSVNVQGIKALEKEYDATTSAELTYTDVTLNNGTIDGIGVTATGKYVSKETGTTVVSITNITLTGNENGNYVVSNESQKTATGLIKEHIHVYSYTQSGTDVLAHCDKQNICSMTDITLFVSASDYSAGTDAMETWNYIELSEGWNQIPGYTIEFYKLPEVKTFRLMAAQNDPLTETPTDAGRYEIRVIPNDSSVYASDTYILGVASTYIDGETEGTYYLTLREAVNDVLENKNKRIMLHTNCDTEEIVIETETDILILNPYNFKCNIKPAEGYRVTESEGDHITTYHFEKLMKITLTGSSLPLLDYTVKDTTSSTDLGTDKDALYIQRGHDIEIQFMPKDGYEFTGNNKGKRVVIITDTDINSDKEYEAPAANRIKDAEPEVAVRNVTTILISGPQESSEEENPDTGAMDVRPVSVMGSILVLAALAYVSKKH